MENTQYRENSDGVSLGRGSNRYDRGGGPRHDRNSGGRGYDWNRGRYDKNRPYSGNRGGFGCPPNPKYKYSATGYRNQEYEEMNDYSNRSRPHDKHSEDHIRDSSPDRNDRARHKDKQNEDHARDPSPDRSSNVQYTQGAEGGRNESMNWNQSQQQGNSGNSEKVYQQGYDNKYDGKRDYYSQGQGRYGAYGGQQCYNRGNSEQYAHNNHWNQPEFYGNWDGTRQKEFPKDRRPRNRVNVPLEFTVLGN